jgi:hypothetical protein
MRLPHDRATHRHSLALAAGESPRLALEQPLEPEDLGGLLHAAVGLVLRHLLQLQPEGDVVVDAEVRVERIALEHHRDIAVARGDVVDHAVADAHDALRDVLEPGDHAERRRLAAAGRADEHHELSVLDGEIEIVDGARTVRVDLADVLERDTSHRSPPARLAPRIYRFSPSSGNEAVTGIRRRCQRRAGRLRGRRRPARLRRMQFACGLRPARA